MFKTVNNHLMLSDTAYGALKRFVQVVLPAFSSLYFGLSGIWGLPATEQVVGTLALVATFLGICLGFSSKSYDESGAALIALDKAMVHDGELEVTANNDGRKVFSLNLNGEPETLAEKGTVSFKVVNK